MVDLSSTFMGPYCTLLLRHWGADVIKVETPGGDVMRYVGDVRGNGMGPVFLNANRGKRSIVLNLKTDSGRGVLRRLIEPADVVVHSLRPPAARRLKLTGADVLEINPRAVYLGFRGYGAGGAYEDQPAYDDVIQAASGIAALQAADGEPRYVRSSVADKTVGLMGAAAVLASLRGRDVSGVGQIVEIPMFETMAGFNLLEQQGGWVFDPPAGPSGYPRTRSPFRKPYRTKDGIVAVMVYTDDQWRAFFEEIGQAHLTEDERFRTIRERTENSDALFAIVESAMAVRTTDEWLEQFRLIGIAGDRINTVEDLFIDPHLASTGFFRRVEHPAVGPLLLPTMPGASGQSDADLLAPLLGQHTREIMTEIGCTARDIDELVEQGAVAESGPAT